MYYNNDTWVIFNQSVNEFYTRFFFKIDALSQDFIFPLELSAVFFNNLIPDVREFFISEGFQVPKKIPDENNHRVDQSLLLVRNEAVEAENNIRTTKVVVQPVSLPHSE